VLLLLLPLPLLPRPQLLLLPRLPLRILELSIWFLLPLRLRLLHQPPPVALVAVLTLQPPQVLVSFPPQRQLPLPLCRMLFHTTSNLTTTLAPCRSPIPIPVKKRTPNKIIFWICFREKIKAGRNYSLEFAADCRFIYLFTRVLESYPDPLLHFRAKDLWSLRHFRPTSLVFGGDGFCKCYQNTTEVS
jgi:hypothetical protein